MKSALLGFPTVLQVRAFSVTCACAKRGGPSPTETKKTDLSETPTKGGGSSPLETKQTNLCSGIRVVARCDGTLPLVAVTVMYQAGSRFEFDNQLGATHFIRAASSSSSSCFTGFIKTRFLQQCAGYITCNSNRQSLAFTLRCPVAVYKEIQPFFYDTVTGPKFYHYELNDTVRAKVKFDLEARHPRQHVIDLVQKAMWAGSLNNSIYCNNHRVDQIQSNDITNFVMQNFIPSKCTISSYGLPFDCTLGLAEEIDRILSLPRHVPKQTLVSSRCRNGFEKYDLGHGSDTWIAIAVAMQGSCHLENVTQMAILAAACGNDDLLRGTSRLDRLGYGPLGNNCPKDIFSFYRAFNIAYLDLGAFGVIAKAPAEKAWKTAIGAHKFMKAMGSLSNKHVDAGKERLKLGILMHLEDCVQMSESLALHAAYGHKVGALHNICSLIQCIPNDHVLCLAKQIAATALKTVTYAVVGDVHAVPNDVELLNG